MKNRNASIDPVALAYQSPIAMPAVGIRAADWIIYRPAQIASGNLILAKFQGAIDVGRLILGSDGEQLFYDGKTGERKPITRSDELQILGIVIAIRSEWAIH
jgi:hypothetical protein